MPLNDGVPQGVNLATGAPIPTSLQGLTSDPYRGLEYSILKNKSSKLFTTTANITPLTLTFSATGVNKFYDGTTSATVTLPNCAPTPVDCVIASTSRRNGTAASPNELCMA